MWLLYKKSWFLLSFAVLIVAGNSCYGQGLPELRHCSVPGYYMDFYVLSSPKKIKYSDTLHYVWFKSQKVHETQGASGGNLLHGTFSKYFDDGQLAEKGEFKYGLKDGGWLTWYPSGSLKSIKHFHKGLRHGIYKTFDENGVLVLDKHYKKGRLKPSSQEINDLKSQEKMAKDSLDTKEEIDKDSESDPTWFERHFKRKDSKTKTEEVEEDKVPWFKRLFKSGKDTEQGSDKSEEKARKRQERDERRTIKKANKQAEE